MHIMTQRFPAPARNRVLNHDDLRAAVPSVFASSPLGRMSGRYRLIPTIEVVDMLADRGFRPVRAEQSRTTTAERRACTKHMIRFRHEDYLPRPDGLPAIRVGDEVPELILVNSHDGTSAYKFLSGIFRFVCLNGMVVQTEDFGSVSVRHSGGPDFAKQVIDATYQVVEDGPKSIAKIDEWKKIELSPAHRMAFATGAAELRPGVEVQPARLLLPKREGDRKPDLWTVGSVVQENVLRGGVKAIGSTGKRTTTRPVKAVAEDVKLNKALWVMMERLAQIVG